MFIRSTQRSEIRTSTAEIARYSATFATLLLAERDQFSIRFGNASRRHRFLGCKPTGSGPAALGSSENDDKRVGSSLLPSENSGETVAGHVQNLKPWPKGVGGSPPSECAL